MTTVAGPVGWVALPWVALVAVTCAAAVELDPVDASREACAPCPSGLPLLGAVDTGAGSLGLGDPVDATADDEGGEGPAGALGPGAGTILSTVTPAEFAQPEGTALGPPEVNWMAAHCAVGILEDNGGQKERGRYLIESAVRPVLGHLQDSLFALPGAKPRHARKTDAADALLAKCLDHRHPVVDVADEGRLDVPRDRRVRAEDANVVAADAPAGDARRAPSRVKVAAGALQLTLVVEAQTGGNLEDKVGVGQRAEAKDSSERGAPRHFVLF